MDWLPDDLDDEFVDNDSMNVDAHASDQQPVPPQPAVDTWLLQHAGKTFVKVGGPVSSKSKFQGEKPGWVFELGGEGLGYYPDVGRVRTVYLFPEMVPWGGTQPAVIELSDLLPAIRRMSLLVERSGTTT